MTSPPPPVPIPDRIDLAIVGGGLAGGLIALALAARRPEIGLLLIEAGESLGGNHVWSFFDGDLSAEGRALVAPLVTAHWEGHDVRFPEFERTVPGGYNSIASEQFDAHLRVMLGERVLTGAEVTALTPNRVALADGQTIEAGGVIDARGGGDLSVLDCGWQKFLGQMLKLRQPHGLDRPVIMDATVDQSEGYRFVYLLPFGPDRLFVEDTYYSDTPGLELKVLEQRIADYVTARGWSIAAVERQETGVLPVVMAGKFDRYWPGKDAVARAGVRAGLFHPTTGYSLPDAVRFALELAGRSRLDGAALAGFSRDWARAHWRRGGYYRLLATMLFRAAEPPARWRIFARFYRLGPSLIARFYAGRSSAWDKARLLCGKPPVPIRAAMRAILGRHN